MPYSSVLIQLHHTPGTAFSSMEYTADFYLFTWRTKSWECKLPLAWLSENQNVQNVPNYLSPKDCLSRYEFRKPELTSLPPTWPSHFVLLLTHWNEAPLCSLSALRNLMFIPGAEARFFQTCSPQGASSSQSTVQFHQEEPESERCALLQCYSICVTWLSAHHLRRFSGKLLSPSGHNYLPSVSSSFPENTIVIPPRIPFLIYIQGQTYSLNKNNPPNFFPLSSALLIQLNFLLFQGT